MKKLYVVTHKTNLYPVPIVTMPLGLLEYVVGVDGKDVTTHVCPACGRNFGTTLHPGNVKCSCGVSLSTDSDDYVTLNLVI